MLYRNQFGPKLPEYLMSLDVVPTMLDVPIIIGGPCSVESVNQMDRIYAVIKDHITHMRGGVFRQGTYPGSQGGWSGQTEFEGRKVSSGWQMELLKAYHAKSLEIGKPNIVEVLDARDLDIIYPYAGAFQVGERQSQHYALLEELGRQNKPVFLKRGTWEKLNELLGSLEYIVKGGNTNVVLIERGSVSYMDHVRWDLSISLIAKLKQLVHLPVIVDAAHGTGDRTIVEQMTLAGIAAGADGCLCETHYDPDGSLSDAEQTISLDKFIHIVTAVRSLISWRSTIE